MKTTHTHHRSILALALLALSAFSLSSLAAITPSPGVSAGSKTMTPTANPAATTSAAQTIGAATSGTGSFKATAATAQAAGLTALTNNHITYKFTGAITTVGSLSANEAALATITSGPKNISQTGALIPGGSHTVTAPVSYRWKHSDGTYGPTKTTTSPKAGTNTIAVDPDEWTITCNGTSRPAWAALEVLSPTPLASANVTFTVPPAYIINPIITTQPANATTDEGGGPNHGVLLVITATASLPITCQWQLSTNAGTTWTNLADTPSTTASPIYAHTTSSRLTIANIPYSMNGSLFRCIAKTTAGSTTSNPATLTVTQTVAAPAITKQPASATVAVGQTATFTVTATGKPTPAYQWQTQPPGSTTWSNIPGATAATLTIPNVTTTYNGVKYRCIATNPAGTATSAIATLTITPPAPTTGTVTVKFLKWTPPYQQTNSQANDIWYANMTATATPAIPAGAVIASIKNTSQYSIRLWTKNTNPAAPLPHTTPAADLGVNATNTTTFAGLLMGTTLYLTNPLGSSGVPLLASPPNPPQVEVTWRK